MGGGIGNTKLERMGAVPDHERSIHMRHVAGRFFPPLCSLHSPASLFPPVRAVRDGVLYLSVSTRAENMVCCLGGTLCVLLYYSSPRQVGCSEHNAYQWAACFTPRFPARGKVFFFAWEKTSYGLWVVVMF